MDSVIIDGEITNLDRPPVQYISLFATIENSKNAYKEMMNSNIVDAALKELNDNTI